VNIKQTLKIDRVEGELNQGDANDKHHGDKAETEYHPVLEVDDKDDYDTVRDKVTSDLDAFATSFSGSWNWRLGWGKNCHTFIDRMKKKLKLHHQSSKQWLLGAGVKGAQPVAALGWDDVLKVWTEAMKGRGYGGVRFGVIELLGKLTLADLVGLTDAQKTRLIGVVNQGVEGFDVVKPDEVNEAIFQYAFVRDNPVDVFEDRHASAAPQKEVAQSASGTGPVATVASGGSALTSAEVDEFVDGLAPKSIITLTKPLSTPKGNLPVGTQAMVREINGDQIFIELPISAGSGRLWIDAADLAAAAS
jgi:hypothetical protein